MLYTLTLPLALLAIPITADGDVGTRLSTVLSDEDIRNTWQPHILDMCLSDQLSPIHSAVASRLYCYRHWLRAELDYVDVEILNRKPAIVRIVKFLPEAKLNAIEEFVIGNGGLEEMRVEGLNYSPGHRGRRADGLWIRHDEKIIRPLYTRIQHVLTVNPAMGEDFLALRYERMGHYAFHYDHLEPMPPSYDDGWFAYFGNRLATALLLVRTAARGGATLFPQLQLAIKPERGDLLLWLNADSNDAREMDSLHAACPIEAGEKIAVSLWIRGNFQDAMQCGLQGAGYEPEGLVRKGEQGSSRFKKRPSIPDWIFDK